MAPPLGPGPAWPGGILPPGSLPAPPLAHTAVVRAPPYVGNFQAIGTAGNVTSLPFGVNANKGDGLVIFVAPNGTSNVSASDNFGSPYFTWPTTYSDTADRIYAIWCPNLFGTNPTVTLTSGTSRTLIVAWLQIVGANSQFFLDGAILGATVTTGAITLPGAHTLTAGDLLLMGTVNQGGGSINTYPAGYVGFSTLHAGGHQQLDWAYSTSTLAINTALPTITAHSASNVGGMYVLIRTLPQSLNQPNIPQAPQPFLPVLGGVLQPLPPFFTGTGFVAPVAPAQVLDDGWDWEGDQDVAPSVSVDSYQQSNQPSLPAQEEWDWWSEEATDDFETDQTLGPSAPVVSAQPPEDSWDWDSDTVEDDLPLEEPVGANQPDRPVEDFQGDDLDNFDDDWEWHSYDSAPIGPAQPPLPPEDWMGDWDEDQPPVSSVDSYQQSNAPILVLCIEDPWDWDADSSLDDDDNYSTDVVGSNQPAPPVEDAWDWEGDQDITPVVSVDSYQQSNAPSVVANSEDPWDWDSEQVPDDDIDNFSTDVVGPNLVLLPSPIYDDAWDWDGDQDITPVVSVDSYQQQDVAVVSVPITYDDDAPYYEDEPEDFFADHFGNIDALQPIYDDAWDWDSELTLEDDSDTWAQDIVGPNLVLLPSPIYDDAWDWDSELVPEDDIDSFGTDAVGPNAPIIPRQIGDDPLELFDEDTDDDIIDHFTNYDAPQRPPEDPWDWETEATLEDDSDGWSTDPVGTGLVVAPAVPEDAWDLEWDEAPVDLPDEPLYDDGANVQNPSVVPAPANCPEDAWDWAEPDDYSDDPPDDDGWPVQNPNPPPPLGKGVRPGGRIIFLPKYASTTETRTFNFLSSLGPNETILTASVAASVYTGVDPSPSAIISGSAGINTPNVFQNFTAGVLGTIYEVACTITTSLGQTLKQVAYFTVIPDLQ